MSVVDRVCETCSHQKVCSAFKAMQDCKEQFEQSYESFVKWPYKPGILALNCNEYKKGD